MKICKNCGELLSKNATFCPKCNALQPKKKKGLFITLIIICAIVLIGTIGSILVYILKDNINSKKLNAVAYTSLRLAISKSAIDNSGEISASYLDALKETVKKVDKNNEWFSNYYDLFYGITKDTDSKRIDYICNSNYCAKFIVEESGLDYYLIDYAFEPKNEKGYRISVTYD